MQCSFAEQPCCRTADSLLERSKFCVLSPPRRADILHHIEYPLKYPIDLYMNPEVERPIKSQANGDLDN
jgi:hypothetical protein